MEAEGAEYNLAVKGDPAAGASLLGKVKLPILQEYIARRMTGG